MPGFQPRLTTDHVWYNGTDIHTYSLSTGLGIRLTEIRGWDDRPDIRDVRETRFQQDGEYANDVYIGGRTITIAGVIHGSSWVNLQSRKRDLAALFKPTATEVLLKIPDPATASPTSSYSTTGMTGYERSSVRPIEGISFGDMIGSCAMTFQVVLRASDPRIYSDTETSTDSGTTGTASRTVTVDQSGTYETPVTLTVTGTTGSAWSITEPSSGLVVASTGLALAASETYAVDTDDRTADFTATYSSVRLKRSDDVAVWMLNETVGSTADNIEGTATYDGTYTGGFTLNQSGPASGVASVALNGTTGYVSIPYNANLHPSSMTFECWVKLDVTSSNMYIADWQQSTDLKGWALYYVTSGNCFRVATNSTLISGPPGVAASTWYHLAVTRDASTCRFYINGVLVASTTGTFTVSAAQSFLGVLHNESTAAKSNYLDGNLGPCAIYNTAMSAETIEDLYNASAATSTVNGYTYLSASSSRWKHLGTGSSTYTLASDGLTTGSKLNVKYRDARL